MNITEVYKVAFMKGYWNYCGLLRNEKKFSIGDDVFLGRHQSIIKCKIVGVELPPTGNPEYRYKVQIPNELMNINNEYEYSDVICDVLFSSLDEAKDSALKSLEKKSRLENEEIERYFKQFEP